MFLKFKINLYVILLLILSANIANAQDSKQKTKTLYSYEQGIEFIEMAQNYINEGKYKKAEKLLKKAKKVDYGFCGNSWITAYADIDYLTVEIYLKQEKYDKALNFLDSIGGCGFGANCEKRDILKIKTLINMYGSEFVKLALDNFSYSEDNTKSDYNFDYDYTVHLFLLDYTLRFTDSRTKAQRSEKNESMEEIIKQQEFYKLL